MNFANLKSTLKTIIKPAYLIYGSDIYLVSKAIDLITEAAQVTDLMLDVSRIESDASPDKILAECGTVSFFGGKRVVVVRPLGNEQIAALKKYLDAPNDNCVLILVLDAVKNTAVSLKNIETVDCNPLQPDLLVRLIANQLATHGKKISPDAAHLLCEYCANTYARIDNEINKLVNYFSDREIIGTQEINQICTRTSEYQIYELSNALCSGNITRSEEILKTLQDSGVEDYAIFGNLVSAFRRLFYSLVCKSTNDAVAAFLACSPYAVLYARRDNKHLTAKIADLYEYALDLEYQIKSGKISVNNAIVLCYSKI